MKNIFSINRSSESVYITIFLVRIDIATLMLTDGISKAELFNETPLQFRLYSLKYDIKLFTRSAIKSAFCKSGSLSKNSSRKQTPKGISATKTG